MECRELIRLAVKKFDHVAKDAYWWSVVPHMANDFEFRVLDSCAPEAVVRSFREIKIEVVRAGDKYISITPDMVNQFRLAFPMIGTADKHAAAKQVSEMYRNHTGHFAAP